MVSFVYVEMLDFGAFNHIYIWNYQTETIDLTIHNSQTIYKNILRIF